MNRQLLGLPIVLWLFVVLILLPIVVGDVVLYRSQRPLIIPCTNKVIEKQVLVTPVATPSATITPAPTKKVLRPTPTEELLIKPTQ